MPAARGTTGVSLHPYTLRMWQHWPRSPRLLENGRRRDGLRICRAAWLLGVTVPEYRELEAGERVPDADTYERIVEVFGWSSYRR